jgi:transmembrane 9 superfamily member 3
MDVTIDSENDVKGFICTLELDSNKVQQFADAIESSYWFEFFIGM